MSAAVEALVVDVADLCGALHLLAAAAEQKGDADSHGALRLLARHGERVAEQVERLAEECADD